MCLDLYTCSLSYFKGSMLQEYNDVEHTGLIIQIGE